MRPELATTNEAARAPLDLPDLGMAGRRGLARGGAGGQGVDETPGRVRDLMLAEIGSEERRIPEGVCRVAAKASVHDGVQEAVGQVRLGVPQGAANRRFMDTTSFSGTFRAVAIFST